MGLLDKLDRHSGLMNRMAETVHADLTDAMSHDKLNAYELRNAVLACMGCENPTDCEHWLQDHKAGAEDTPDYCRNRDMMLRLRG